jgi:hypothetical protein
MHTRVNKSRSLAAAHWTATACSSNLQPATAATAATCSLQQQPIRQQQPAAATHWTAAAYSNNIVAALDDFAVSTEDAVTHQECPFITSRICMQGAQHLEKKEEILSCFEDFITFCSLLHSTYCSQQKSYLLELQKELPVRVTYKEYSQTTCGTTCRSCVKSYLLELPDDYLSEQCNKIKSVTAGHFK